MKKFLGIIATLAMVLSITIGTPLHAEETALEEKVAEVNGVTYSTINDAIKNANVGDTVKLISNEDSSEKKIVFDKSLIFDLNGKTLKSSNCKNSNISVLNSTLTLIDTVGTGKIYSETIYKDASTGSGILEVSGDNAKLVMNSGYIYAVNANPVLQGQFGITVFNGGDVEINGGKIETGWYAVSGNGTQTQQSDITVNGGELISTSDYAIYNPQKGTLTINGGVVYGAAGGVNLNRGELIVNGGTITSSGKGETGEWGDGTGGLGNAAINLSAKYDSVTATINAGKIIAESNAIVIDKKSQNPVDLIIKGGTFSSDVKDYLDLVSFKTIRTEEGYKVVPVTIGVKLNETSLMLNTTDKKEATLIATLEPVGAMDNLTWESSNTKVATVDKNGKVTAIGAGNATITVKTLDGKFATTCEVLVTNPIKPNVPTVDASKPVENVEVGMPNKEETQNILNESIANDSELLGKIAESQAKGENVEVVPTIEKIDVEKAPSEVKNEIVKADKVAKEEKLTVAEYLDLSIVVKVDNKELGKVSETTDELTFQVAIPQELIKKNREFYIIRVHNGVTDILEVVENNGAYTFKTDKFSTYALAYKDGETKPEVKPEEETPNEEEIQKPIQPTDPEEPKDENKPTSPEKEDEKVNTGDVTMPIAYAMLVLVSGAILFVLKKKQI